MAGEGLAEKLQAAFQKLNNRGKLTEKDDCLLYTSQSPRDSRL